MAKTHQELVQEVNQLIEPYGCKVTSITADAVGVMGDSRVYAPGVTISIPKDMTMERIGQISTEIINKVKGISRVLFDIPLG